nr:hypothetical protein [Enterobacter roggenkampii]
MSNGIWRRRARLVAIACAAVVGLGGETADPASPLLIVGATIFDATRRRAFPGRRSGARRPHRSSGPDHTRALWRDRRRRAGEGAAAGLL